MNDPRGERRGAAHNVGEGDRLEVSDRVVGHLLEDELVRRMARSDDHQCLSIGRALGDEIGAEIVGSAGLILDDDRLPHGHCQLVGNKPRGF
jgi:hypothetical protein